MSEAENPPPLHGGARAKAPRGSGGMVGETLAGRYRLIGRLGAGAMGEVYLGEHLSMGRHDAIKVLSGRYVDDPDLRTRFLRGARNLARIRHPNVCTVYDFGETDDGAQFLAIEYVAGGTLGQLAARTGPLPLRRALRIAIQVAHGLQAAHDQGIVHRDLKPDNVMLGVDRDGRDQAKVVDFDIAKGEADDSAEDVTRIGAIIGTPRYMSPEQLLGDPLDGRSDLYSLGLVTFWMLTGQLPFAGETAREMTGRRLESRALTLEEVASGRFPSRLDEELQRVLRRDVEGRHQSAKAFADALSAMLPDDDWIDEGDDTAGTQVMERPPAFVRATPPALGDAGPALAGPRQPELPPLGTVVAPLDAKPRRSSSIPRATSRGRVLASLAAGATLVVAVVIGMPGSTRLSQVDGSATAGDTLVGARMGPSPDAPATGSATGAEESPGARFSDDVTDRVNGEEAPPTLPEADAAPPRERVDTETGDDPDAVLSTLRRFAVELSTGPGVAVGSSALGDSARVVWERSDLGVEVRHWSAYVIGLSELKLERQDSALAWVERALELDPLNRGYQALQSALRARAP